MLNIKTQLKGGSSAAKVVSILFNARTNAHFAHLQTTSYAQHKALDDFYSGVVDLADRFAETYQGSYGIIKGYTLGTLCTDSITQCLEQQRSQIYTLRSDFTDSCLLQILDDVAELYNSTLYKLKVLR